MIATIREWLPRWQETWVHSLGQEVSLEKEMATHSRILAWEIPWSKGHVGCCLWGLKEQDVA